jgi:MoxR-like ATPase
MIFDKLQVYGISEKNEIAILASLLTGYPSLFIGSPGSGKTALIEMLGACMRESSKKRLLPLYKSGKLTKEEYLDKIFSYHIYDSSKLNFEDIIGFINPKKLAEGELTYIKTPTTIWNKKLVGFDEINRCLPERQSNLFEIIRSRRCMGQPTNTSFIFSAMNPYGDEGTELMSSALVDRYLFYLEFADLTELNEENREKILKRVGESELVGLKLWKKDDSKIKYENDFEVNNYLASIGEKLSSILKEASIQYEKVQNSYSSVFVTFIDQLFMLLKSHSKSNNLLLSGRRANMLNHAMTSTCAIKLALGEELDIPTVIYNVINLGIPVGVDGKLTLDESKSIRSIIETVTDSILGIIKEETNINLVKILFQDSIDDCLPYLIEATLNKSVEPSLLERIWNLAVKKSDSATAIYRYMVSIIEYMPTSSLTIAITNNTIKTNKTTTIEEKLSDEINNILGPVVTVEINDIFSNFKGKNHIQLAKSVRKIKNV